MVWGSVKTSSRRLASYMIQSTCNCGAMTPCTVAPHLTTSAVTASIGVCYCFILLFALTHWFTGSNATASSLSLSTCCRDYYMMAHICALLTSVCTSRPWTHMQQTVRQPCTATSIHLWRASNFPKEPCVLVPCVLVPSLTLSCCHPLFNRPGKASHAVS